MIERLHGDIEQSQRYDRDEISYVLRYWPAIPADSTAPGFMRCRYGTNDPLS